MHLDHFRSSPHASAKTPTEHTRSCVGEAAVVIRRWATRARGADLLRLCHPTLERL